MDIVKCTKMIYELAHFVKDRCGFIWDMVEWGNASLFANLHKKALCNLPLMLEDCSGDYTYRLTTLDDIQALEEFFARQPEDAFTFFNPHAFDAKAIKKVINNKAFLTFVALKDTEIVGYFFLRCFVNGKCFRGKIVDNEWRGRGIAKQMGIITTKVAKSLGLKMFGTISPDNISSLESSKASNTVKIHKVLANGYYYIEYLPKEI